MDFNQLMARMRELDQPAVEQPTSEECGMPPPGMGMPPMPSKPDVPPPSMSVNLNAQGLENIEDMMKLFQKVNPDMMGPKEPMPTLGMEPSIMSIKPSLPPLKMLPDFDADNDDKIGGEEDPMMKMDLDKDDSEMDSDYDKDGKLDAHEKDHASEKPLLKSLDRDSDGDHDMDDLDAEKKDKEEAFGNSVGDSEPETMDVDSVVPDGNDLHKKKNMFKAAAGGDNPMAAESTDLRSQIRAELLRRLEEAKGVK